ncbi:MAG: DUF4292 domain-containing protein [Prevotella sp.]|nr:DUF4292 domain-containing protein [Prevotella sp.]
MKQKTLIQQLALAAILATMCACGSKKALVDNTKKPTTQQTNNQATEQSEAFRKSQYLQRVADNAVYTDFINAKMKMKVNTGSKEITLPAVLRMHKDDVIRIQVQVPIIGTEAARLEFTKDYVLIVDRIHKEYCKGDYNQLDFLKRNGLTFSSLQALFWNQLFVPGADQINEAALKQLDVQLDKGATTPITLKKGNMTYQWQTNSKTALIEKATINYNSKQSGNTKVDVTYNEFRQIGVKQFPSFIGINANTTALKGGAKKLNVDFDMSSVNTENDWELRTNLSKKYEEKKVEDVLKRVISL